VRRTPTNSSLLLLSLATSSCAVYEGLGGVPYAETEVQVPAHRTTERALDCVRDSILSLSPQKETAIAPGVSFKSKQGMWATDVTRLDYKRGVLETGNYPMPNIVGLRVRAVYLSSSSRLRLQLKAAGPYYADLGATENVAELRLLVSKCVEA